MKQGQAVGQSKYETAPYHQRNIEQTEIVEDLRKIAKQLKKNTVFWNEYEKLGKFSPDTVRNKFGSWNEGLRAAGLDVTRTRGSSNEEYFHNLKAVWDKLGRQPRYTEMKKPLSKFSVSAYEKRFGSWTEALTQFERSIRKTKELAKRDLGKDNGDDNPRKTSSSSKVEKDDVEYGEPIDVRGLRHAPVNEQGVVFLFGMLARELGYEVEAIRSGYPDCEAKRQSGGKKKRWEKVRIEFEHQSHTFVVHGHDPDKCDIIVCWEDNWPDCPIEILELRNHIQKLKENRHL